MTDKQGHHGYCLNCNHPMSSDDRFCSNCGQADHESKLSFIEIIREAILNLFNLDSRLIHTLKDIYAPSKLTKAFVAGKRRFYVHPVRLFIFSLIVLVTLALYQSDFSNKHFGVDDFYSEIEKSKLKSELNHAVDSLGIPLDSIWLDSLNKTLFKGVESYEGQILGKNLDLGFASKDIKDYKITMYDAAHLTPDEIFKKYEITGFWERVTVRQYLKFRFDIAGGIKYAIKNGIWAILIHIFFAAFILYILYIRNRLYYIEHLILLLNIHSFGFILGVITLLMAMVSVETAAPVGAIFSVIFILSLIIAFKRYYQQGYIKTIIKLFLFSMTYFFIFIFILLFFTIVSLYLY